MAAPKNYAAFVESKGAHPLVVKERPLAEPKEGHVVIKTAAVAVVPVDYMMQGTGFFINEDSYPFVLGCDIAGTIYSSKSTMFKTGDRVMAHANNISSQDPAEGGFQHYVEVPAVLISKIPDTMRFTDATILPLSITTASSGLFSSRIFNLPQLTLDAKPMGKTILVWGGSSSVGGTTVQLAKATGLRVLTTASAKNAEYCKELGADEVFDHTHSDIVDKLAQAVNHTNKDFVGVYDAIDQPSSQKPIHEFLQKIGGGLVASVLSEKTDLPEGLTSKAITAPWQGPGEKEIQAVWSDFVPQALEKGVLKPAPPAMVVGRGLAAVQGAIDLLKKGVSRQKIVVEI